MTAQAKPASHPKFHGSNTAKLPPQRTVKDTMSQVFWKDLVPQSGATSNSDSADFEELGQVLEELAEWEEQLTHAGVSFDEPEVRL